MACERGQTVTLVCDGSRLTSTVSPPRGGPSRGRPLPQPISSAPTDPAPRGKRGVLRSLALVAAGMLLAVALGGIVILVDLRFDGGRLVQAAMGSADLADACRAPLVRRLAERGFQPEELEFGPEPTLGSPWARERSFGDSFNFRDGVEGTRIDGVLACVLSGTNVTVDFRVAQNPRRPA